ncbi:MAG: glycosyltransferase [Cyanobacteria bacterium]|nr:glycosyltransferase [Cyanobacteriota bacterium]
MLSVVIPTYKNKIQLLNNLKSNIRFLEKEQIIIVNDNPKESLKADLNIYKNVILIENSKNFGFGLSINIGVEKAKTKYIMLLNDDVLLLNTDFEKNLNSFKSNTDLFAISFAQKEITGEIIGKNKFFWHNGLFFHQRSDNLKYGLNAWAEGGACIIDKEKFKELKGFDLLFAPFYWEDIGF